MLINYGDRLASTSTKEEEIEQLLGVIMAEQYSLKSSLNYLGERWNIL